MKNTPLSSKLSFLAVLSGFIFHANAAEAQWHHHDWRPCLNYSETSLVGETILHYTGTCSLSEPLSLTRGDHFYPAMNGGTTLRVDYWAGTYSRNADISQTYVTTTYDCWGNILGSQSFNNEITRPVQFSLINPNLGDDITVSFVANAPMTEAEAKAALSEALNACTNATP